MQLTRALPGTVATILALVARRTTVTPVARVSFGSASLSEVEQKEDTDAKLQMMELGLAREVFVPAAAVAARPPQRPRDLPLFGLTDLQEVRRTQAQNDKEALIELGLVRDIFIPAPRPEVELRDDAVDWTEMGIVQSLHVPPRGHAAVKARARRGWTVKLPLEKGTHRQARRPAFPDLSTETSKVLGSGRTQRVAKELTPHPLREIAQARTE
jgi:hypothetical protein